VSNITEAKVLAALSHVDDPDLKRDIVSLHMVRDIKIDGRHVMFTVVLTTPACPMKDVIRQACETAIKTLVAPDAEVSINMTAVVTPQQQTSPLPGVKNIIAVASGKGGVGKSTVAVNLAIGLALTDAKVGIVDADIYGPSVPLLTGLPNGQPYVQEVDGKQKMLPLERYGVSIMSIGFLIDKGQAVVWRGPMASNALRQLVADTLWGELDYLVIDMPPGTGDIHITIAQQFGLSGAVIVTTPQEVALADARKALHMLVSPQINVPVLGIVENMAYFTPPDLPDRRYYIFGEGGGQKLSAEYNAPLLAQIPLVETIRSGGDVGAPPVLLDDSPVGAAFRGLAQQVARQVAIRNAQAHPAVQA